LREKFSGAAGQTFPNATMCKPGLSFFVTSIGFGPKGALPVQLEAVQALPIGSIREDFDERVPCPSKGENSGKAYTPGTDKTDKPPFVSFGSDRDRRVFGIDKLPGPNPAEIEERKGMAADSVPERYLDAWVRLERQGPAHVTVEQWRQAIDDAGRFLAQWGKLADSFGWTPGDLFDLPRDGAMGLVWWLKGRTVSALGPEQATITLT
jgi:hypothetical protein